MMFDVEVNNVTMKYKHFAALKNISFKLEGGKIYGLLGRNGAGKTTLLSLLSSLREPTEGSIKIGGEAPFENANIMQHVAFVYEVDYKDESAKIKSMIELAARYEPNFDATYAEHLVKRFKLPLEKRVNQLSQGMQSALNVTMGLACRAPLTIFDEAYVGMDAPTREIFYQELLADQSEHPRTMILSTHLVSEMDYLFEEVLIMDKGTLLLQEEVETLQARGVSITGAAEEVDRFVGTMKQLNVQQLGSTKSVMVYGELSEGQRNEALQQGLEVGPISLQDLFIHLTEEEA